MTKRAILVSLFLAVTAGPAAAEPLVDGSVEAGREKAAVCAGCHGVDGNSMSAQYPKLAGQGAPYLFMQLELFKSGTRDNPIMVAQAQALSEQDMRDLAAYFAAQQIKPGVVPDPELAQAGAVIYHGGKPETNVPACSGCHGPAGLGNPAARYPRISGQHAEYIVQELKAYRSGERGGYPRAEVMQGVAQGLSNDDIQALAAYITGLTPAEPGALNTSGALLQDLPEPETGGAGAGSESQPSGAEGAAAAAPQGEAGQDQAAEGGQPADGGQPATVAPQDEPAQDQAAEGGAQAGAAAGGGQPTEGDQPAAATPAEDTAQSEANAAEGGDAGANGATPAAGDNAGTQPSG